MSRLRHKALAGAAALLAISHARAESETATFSIASGGHISTLTRTTFIRSVSPQAMVACIFGKAHRWAGVVVYRASEMKSERRRCTYSYCFLRAEGRSGIQNMRCDSSHRSHLGMIRAHNSSSSASRCIGRTVHTVLLLPPGNPGLRQAVVPTCSLSAASISPLDTPDRAEIFREKKKGFCVDQSTASNIGIHAVIPYTTP